MRLRVKVCGITRPEDGLAAAELGADAVGLVFAPGSPRQVDLATARAICRELPPFVARVGVVVNPEPDELARIAGETGIDWIQFHGEETPDRCQAATLPWLKAFRVGEGFELDALAPYATDLYLLDADQPDLRGGSGRTADWAVAARIARQVRVVLAGGLGPGNILEAVSRVHPYAVDLNSGVESAPGRKDRAALERVFAQLRSGDYL